MTEIERSREQTDPDEERDTCGLRKVFSFNIAGGEKEQMRMQQDVLLVYPSSRFLLQVSSVYQ